MSLQNLPVGNHHNCQVARLVVRRIPIKGIFSITTEITKDFAIYHDGNNQMRPLTAINGILLGSCVAITVSLTAVLVVFLVLGDDYPRLQGEFDALVASVLIFLGMTAISAASFYTLVINHKARFIAQAALWGGLVATTLYYLP